MPNLEPLIRAVVEGDKARAESLARALSAEGVDPLEIVNRGLIPAMAEVGDKFQRNEYYVPEMLRSARAMKAAMAVVRPAGATRVSSGPGKVVIGTVRGDLHDIGKNLVVTMLEGAGFEVLDLGVDAAPEKFVAAVKDGGARLVGMSALLTTTMLAMRDVLAALEGAGLRSRVRVIVGGAPITQEYAAEIGADGYAPDAVSAVRVSKTLLGDS